VGSTSKIIIYFYTVLTVSDYIFLAQPVNNPQSLLAD